LAKARAVDRAKGAPLADEDREAAKALRSAVKTISGKKRKKKSKPFFRMVWFQAAGIILLLAAAVGVIWLVTRPPSAETLYERGMALWRKGDEGDPDKWSEAREGPFKDYLRNYGNRDDERTRDVRKRIQIVDTYDRYVLLQRLVKTRKGTNTGPSRRTHGTTCPARMGLDAAMAENAALANREIWAALREKAATAERREAWVRPRPNSAVSALRSSAAAGSKMPFHPASREFKASELERQPRRRSQRLPERPPRPARRGWS
jgi:hypothetical protein